LLDSRERGFFLSSAYLPHIINLHSRMIGFVKRKNIIRYSLVGSKFIDDIRKSTATAVVNYEFADLFLALVDG